MSAKTAQLGRDVIQAQEDVKQKEIIRNEREADLAMRISPSIIRARLESEGFIDATLDNIEFTTIDGLGRGVEFTPPVPDSYITDYDHMLSPAFTETLIDGFRRWFELEDPE